MKKMALGIIILFLLSHKSYLQEVRLMYHETQKFSTLDPVTMGNSVSVRIVELLFGSLYTFDLDREIIPEFAEAMPVLSSDNLSVTVKMKSGLKWSDNSDITIDDIIFSWKAYIDPMSDGDGGALLKKIVKNIQKYSSNTIKITFNKKVIFPERYLTFFIIPENSFHGKTAIRKHLSYCRYPKVVSGQYVIDKKDPNVHSIDFKLNKYYSLKKPTINKIEHRFYSNKAFLPSLILGGTTDMLTSFNLENYAELNASEAVKVKSYESNSLPVVIINHDNPVLKQIEIRQALDMAINRHDLLESLYSGQGNLISGPFPYNSPYNNTDVDPTEYSMEKAKNLLESIGYIEGADGFMEKNGEILKLDFVVFTSDDPTMSALFTNLKKMWENIGIKINLKSYMKNTFYDALQKRKFDLIYFQRKFDISADIYTLYSSEYGKKGQPNFGNYQNPMVDRFLKQSMFSVDFQTKMEINKKLHEIIHNDVANIFLWQIPAYAAYSSKLKNVTLDPFYFFTTIADWEKDESEENLGDDWFK
jgi:peptide/nickel transport system substrate-binding protein